MVGRFGLCRRLICLFLPTISLFFWTWEESTLWAAVMLEWKLLLATSSSIISKNPFISRPCSLKHESLASVFIPLATFFSLSPYFKKGIYFSSPQPYLRVVRHRNQVRDIDLNYWRSFNKSGEQNNRTIYCSQYVSRLEKLRGWGKENKK